jgi:subfamily B ATP-binding cassette protein MsbA
MAYQPIKGLAKLHNALHEGLAAAERVFAMLDVRPEIGEAADARALAVGGGEIRLESVSFSYGDELPALEDVSMTVPAGATVALVGPSGAGKSTLLNLIPRFYDASGGSIGIDGQEVRGVTLSSLRQAIALVSQEATLFDDTVLANIAYGRPGASETEIIAAARAADAHDFIEALADGYQTIVGEDGLKLSGGQRQRIAIARAMVRDAPILLLDEATSALDSESDAQVQAALRRLMRDRTTLVIAHRLATVVAADTIYVMDKGRIVEVGSHQELVAKGGLYARLHALQFADTGAGAGLREVGT